MAKPEKSYIYSPFKRWLIGRKARLQLRHQLKKYDIQEAYITGSLVEGKFGIYERIWTDAAGYEHEGSDIDVIIPIKHNQKIPGVKTSHETGHGGRIYKFGHLHLNINGRDMKHSYDLNIVPNEHKDKVLKETKRFVRII